MSKIFIISNTNFNVSKNLSIKDWLKNMDYYYHNEFLPYLKKEFDENDILIHLGNLTYKTKSIDLNVLKFMQDLFEKISNILPVYIIEGENDKLPLNIIKNINNINIISEPTEIELLLDQKFLLLPNRTNINIIDDFESDYCFFNIDYLNLNNKDLLMSKLKKFKKCYNGYYDKNSIFSNIKNLTSPYNIDSDEKRGFIVLETHTNKDKFIFNKFGPNFKKISINTIEDLNISTEIFKNNYISLIINKQLLVDNKTKIDILLSEDNITNVIYSDNEILKDKDEIILNENNLTLNEMILDYINKLESDNKDVLIEEFKNIVKLNKNL